MNRRILIGAFAGAHGVRGEAKVKCFTEDPSDIASYGPVESEDRARFFTLTVLRAVRGDMVIVRAPEIRSREDAEALALRAGNRVQVVGFDDFGELL